MATPFVLPRTDSPGAQSVSFSPPSSSKASGTRIVWVGVAVVLLLSVYLSVTSGGQDRRGKNTIGKRQLPLLIGASVLGGGISYVFASFLKEIGAFPARFIESVDAFRLPEYQHQPPNRIVLAERSQVPFTNSYIESPETADALPLIIGAAVTCLLIGYGAIKIKTIDNFYVSFGLLGIGMSLYVLYEIRDRLSLPDFDEYGGLHDIESIRNHVSISNRRGAASNMSLFMSNPTNVTRRR